MKWYAGLGALAAGAAVGAGIGAITKPNDLTGKPSASWGAGIGATTGILLVGIAGLGAALSPKYRAPGLTAAGVTTGLVLAGAARHY